jgi:hypothetical protein
VSGPKGDCAGDAEMRGYPHCGLDLNDSGSSGTAKARETCGVAYYPSSVVSMNQPNRVPGSRRAPHNHRSRGAGAAGCDEEHEGPPWFSCSIHWTDVFLLPLESIPESDGADDLRRGAGNVSRRDFVRERSSRAEQVRVPNLVAEFVVDFTA